MASCFQNWIVTQASMSLTIGYSENTYKKQTKILLQKCMAFCNLTSLAVVLGKFKHLFSLKYTVTPQNWPKLLNKNCNHQFASVQNELDLEF